MAEFFSRDALRKFEKAVGKHGARLDAGLTKRELDAAQEFVGASFPPDLVAFLSQAVVVGERFPEWRRFNDGLREQLQWPLEGLLFDIEHNDLWLSSWGERPATLEDQRVKLRRVVENAPRLIPIYGHRYLPAEPRQAGNPVLSVYQSDIIYYGSNLADYLEHEFGCELNAEHSASSEVIPFWSELLG